MAGSRLSRIGTIFARTNALLTKNVLSVEEKPIWFDVYALHPPFEEPRYDRLPENVVIRDIFYAEDIVRAKFHSKVPRQGTINLSDNKSKTRTQKFIKIYDQLNEQGPLDDEKIFEVASEQLNSVKEAKEFFMPAFARVSKIPAASVERNQGSPTESEETQLGHVAGGKKQPEAKVEKSQKHKLEKPFDVKDLF